MLYGITTREFSNSINESFYPVYDFNHLSTLYESMHSFGAADFLHNVLNILNDKASEEIQQYFEQTKTDKGIFRINPNETDCLDNLDYDEDFEITELIEYETGTDWCEYLTISASVFAADTIYEARQMFRESLKGYPSFCCNSVRNSAYVCLFSLAYVNGEMICLSGHQLSIEEGLYHELMHRYVDSVDSINNRPTQRQKPSRFLKTVLRLSDGCVGTDKIIDGIFNISYSLYGLSESEMAAHLAQNKERFASKDIKTKKDFYNLLNSSLCQGIIKSANKAISFIDGYLSGNIIETNNSFDFIENVNVFSGEDINDIDDLLKKLISDWRVNSIREFEKELIKRVDVFKHKLYNVAYDSLPDDVKHKITEEYFSF